MTIKINITGMTSFGQPSNTERTLATIPTKSAFVGLLATAFGYDLEDQEKLQHIYSAISFGVAIRDKGVIQRDFQTAMDSIRANGKVNQNAVMLEREYINDVDYVVCIEAKLEYEKGILKSLFAPVGMLYMGKKSCPVNADFYTSIEQETLSLNEALLSVGGLKHYSDIKPDCEYFTLKTRERITNVNRCFGSRAVYVF